MNNTKKTISIAITSAFALSISASSVYAGENPFSAKTLSAGYQVAENDTKMKDGKCATGQCGASKKSTTKKEKEAASNTEMKKEITDKSSTSKAKEVTSKAEMKK